MTEETIKRTNQLTTGGVFGTLVAFALPYLLASFMQTFYGMADLMIVGLYNGAATTTAVSVGSQVMHMITVMVIGLSMGATVVIGRQMGANEKREAAQTVGNTAVLFAGVAVVLTIILLALTAPLVSLMLTPAEAVVETQSYLRICFAGIPAIIAYNVVSSVFRGVGDSRMPMYFVAVACVINILLDFVLIGPMQMGAAGAALGTVCAQIVATTVAVVVIVKRSFGFRVTRADFRPTRVVMGKIMTVGAPICLQDGFIQIAFIIVTIIANSRGVVPAASVGIVEKIIGFLFLVPSAMLSALSAMTAQNIGAGKPERAKKALVNALGITMVFGMVMCLYCQLAPQTLVGLFTQDAQVLSNGCDYLQSYAFDCFFAGIHFCFSGYFCGCGRSFISFVHNVASIILMRVPGAYLASVWWPDSLYPMGWAAPLGSLISVIICLGFYIYYSRSSKG